MFTAVKIVGSLVVGLGSSVIANNVVKMATPAITSKALQVCVKVGGTFLAAGIAGAAVSQFNGIVDSVDGLVKVIKTKTEKLETTEEGA